MALNRREFLLSLCAGAALGCASTSGPSGSRSGYVELASARGKPGSKGNILVCMPETAQTKEVWTGLSDELGREFDLVALKIDSRNGASSIAEGMRRYRPSSVVLMNNPTVAAYQDYQRTSGRSEFPPAVIVMTSFLDERPRQIVAATGISYEVPLITVVTNLRKLIASPIERVGVILRAPLEGFVKRQAALAGREQISVSEEIVSAAPNASELKRALRRIKQRVDALWILNDDRLLTTQLIADGWLPGLNERPWVPAIVGVGSLVSPARSFGTFAVLPDHTALGEQAASLVLDIADNDWKLSADTQVELPLSTTTTVDLVQVRERFALQRDALERVDRILE